jgi:hypothetical protein
MAEVTYYVALSFVATEDACLNVFVRNAGVVVNDYDGLEARRFLCR